MLDLAENLQKNGFKIIMDQTHLKYGYDKYAFMEKMITDSSISKIFIICNKDYALKADNRVGGVGDESMIITPELYGKTEQSKFIPIVFEKDTNGKPYLPVYLKRLMYVDLSNKRQYKVAYYELIKQMRQPIFDHVCSCLENKGSKVKVHFNQIFAEFEIGDTALNKFVTWITNDGILLFFQNVLREIPKNDANIQNLNEFDTPYGKFYLKENSDAEGTLDLIYSYEIINIEGDALQNEIEGFIDWLKIDYYNKALDILNSLIILG